MLLVIVKIIATLVISLAVYLVVWCILWWTKPSDEFIYRLVMFCILVMLALIRDWGPVEENDDFTIE